MTTTEKMLLDLRRAAPMEREFKLADIAKVYGTGFAATLRTQIEQQIKDARK